MPAGVGLRPRPLPVEIPPVRVDVAFVVEPTTFRLLAPTVVLRRW